MMGTMERMSVVGMLMGLLLLTSAGILVFVVDPKAASGISSPARFLQTGVGAEQTGLSGTPSDSSSSGSKSFDNSLFGGNHVTLAPFGVAGGEFIAYIVGAFLTIIYAFFYKQHVVDQIAPMRKQPATGRDDFEVNICDCFMDACTCVHLLLPCCQFVRQSHTNEVTKICGFWPTFFAYAVSGVCCMLGPCCLTVYFRMKLKEHMGIEDHLLNDLCCAWLCFPCAIGQQGMAVDQKLGYEVELCCTLNWLSDTKNVWNDAQEDY